MRQLLQTRLKTNIIGRKGSVVKRGQYAYKAKTDFPLLAVAGWTGNVNCQSDYPEVDLVLARMSNLSGAETTAITNFVVGCVDDGNWDKLDDFWCFALNGTDWLTGWIANTASIVTAGVTRITDGAQCTGGVLQTGVDLGLQTNYQLGDSEIGVFVHTCPDWGTANFDWFGVEDGTANRTRIRHRGNDTEDARNSINNTATTDNVVLMSGIAGHLHSLRDDDNDGLYLIDGAAQPEALAAGAQVPTGFDVRIFSSNNSGANSQGAKDSTFTSFYVGAEIDTVSFLGRLTTLHTAIGVT